MARIKFKPLNALAAALVVPPALLLLLITAPIGWFNARPRKRSANEVANILTRAALGSVSEQAWRRFIRKEIVDSKLDAIRERAITIGPPDADKLMLRQLIAEVNAITS